MSTSLGSYGKGSQFTSSANFKPCVRPQSTKIFFPSTSKRKLAPVTEPVPPQNVILAVFSIVFHYTAFPLLNIILLRKYIIEKIPPDKSKNRSEIVSRR